MPLSKMAVTKPRSSISMLVRLPKAVPWWPPTAPGTRCRAASGRRPRRRGGCLGADAQPVRPLERARARRRVRRRPERQDRVAGVGEQGGRRGVEAAVRREHHLARGQLAVGKACSGDHVAGRDRADFRVPFVRVGAFEEVDLHRPLAALGVRDRNLDREVQAARRCRRPGSYMAIELVAAL